MVVKFKLMVLALGVVVLVMGVVGTSGASPFVVRRQPRAGGDKSAGRRNIQSSDGSHNFQFPVTTGLRRRRVLLLGVATSSGGGPAQRGCR